MGISHNSQNKADLFGFEMKDDSKSKTTFGDWSADYYIFNDPQFAITRDDFLRLFGQVNKRRKGRSSWSGKPCPNIRGYTFGQKLAVDAKPSLLNTVFRVMHNIDPIHSPCICSKKIWCWPDGNLPASNRN